jgi:hypothetical protein
MIYQPQFPRLALLLLTDKAVYGIAKLSHVSHRYEYERGMDRLVLVFFEIFLDLYRYIWR